MSTEAYQTPNALRALGLLIKREMLAEKRNWGWLASSMLLGLTLVILVGIGFFPEPASASKSAMTTAALWLGFLFAGSVGVTRNFAGERSMGSLEALLMLPFDRWVIYLAKVFSGLVFLLATLALMLVAGVVFADLSLGSNLGALALVMLLAAVGYVSMATLIAAMTSSMRGRDALLAITLFPLVIPLFLIAVGATRNLAQGDSLSDILQGILLLIAIDAGYLAMGILTFDKAIEA